MFAPFAASEVAIPNPIPLVDPVTSAVSPLNMARSVCLSEKDPGPSVVRPPHYAPKPRFGVAGGGSAATVGKSAGRPRLRELVRRASRNLLFLRKHSRIVSNRFDGRPTGNRASRIRAEGPLPRRELLPLWEQRAWGNHIREDKDHGN